jgi:hypothetical protein
VRFPSALCGRGEEGLQMLLHHPLVVKVGAMGLAALALPLLLRIMGSSVERNAVAMWPISASKR